MTAAAVTVRVPATSANLGPGFDALGLALAWYDEYTLTPAAGDTVTVRMTGEGAAELPGGSDHLVARAVLRAARRFDLDLAGFVLDCHNRIPQGRGLGSSAAAIVGGVALAGALAGGVPDADVVAVATEIEGHPDNVAAAALGGLTVAWLEGAAGRAVRVPLDDRVTPVVLVPAEVSPTEAARAALPATVTHGDAAFAAGRSALLVAALGGAPALLLPATEDRLHQEQRRGTFPAAMAAVDELRSAGFAAVISGAGPSVLVLAPAPDVAAAAAAAAPAGFVARVLPVGSGVSVRS